MKTSVPFIISIIVLGMLSLSGCNNDSTSPNVQTNSPAPTIFSEETIMPTNLPAETIMSSNPMGGKTIPENLPVESSKSSNTDTVLVKYTMLTYTNPPNQNSSIKIQYPSFSGSSYDEVNNLIYKKVQSLAEIDTSWYSVDTGMTVDYQSSITLQNSKMISIIFWGYSNIEGANHPFSDLISYNIDLKSFKEVKFEDLYVINADFEKVFFEKAKFPTDPVTSYDQDAFSEMLKYQTTEYQSVSPFSTPTVVSCFLKPGGIVLSMPAVHATGSDHFEAQIQYSDIQQFYLLKQNYWEN